MHVSNATIQFLNVLSHFFVALAHRLLGNLQD